MKNIQTFALGMLSGILVIACGGSADSGAAAGPQTVKIDPTQLQQIIGASGGGDGKWKYQLSTFKDLNKWGDKGGVIASWGKDKNGNVQYIMQLPKE